MLAFSATCVQKRQLIPLLDDDALEGLLSFTIALGLGAIFFFCSDSDFSGKEGMLSLFDSESDVPNNCLAACSEMDNPPFLILEAGLVADAGPALGVEVQEKGEWSMLC